MRLVLSGALWRYWRRGNSGWSRALVGISGRRGVSVGGSTGTERTGADARQIFSNERAAFVAVSAHPAAKLS